MTSAIRSTTRNSISADQLRRGLIAGAHHLARSQEVLDRLNVFPVPDGDTGHNMVATYVAGAEALDEVETRSIRSLGDAVTPPMVRQSRGNSGFILARFFDGFFTAVGDATSLTAELLSVGFADGLFRVTSSLMDPVEGTALTVISAMATNLASNTALPALEAFKRATAAGRDALATTPDLLPILAKAGVIDSGALGFLLLCEAIVAGIEDSPIPVESEEQYRFPPREVDVDTTAATRYRYCTELVLSAFSGPSPAEIRDFLAERGDSIALHADGELIKLHIHTNVPDEIFAYLSPFGSIETKKVEDMHAQIRAAAATDGTGSCNVLAIVPGVGFSRVFADLGISHTLECPDALPATGEIVDAIDAIDAANVIVLANDRNIIPAATLAGENSTRSVTVLPTTTVVEGLSAAYGFSENTRAVDNVASMTECTGLAESFSVHQASTDSRFGSTSIQAGEFFVAREDSIVANTGDLGATVVKALGEDSLGIEERANVTLFAGAALEDSAAEALTVAVSTAYPHVEVELLDGGQKRAVVIVSIE